MVGQNLRKGRGHASVEQDFQAAGWLASFNSFTGCFRPNLSSPLQVRARN